MKVLLVKLSSMGDIFHTYPALSDLHARYPNAELTWLVDSSFEKIAQWHPFVKRTIALPLRKIKKDGYASHKAVLNLALATLKAEKFDVIIDAQGLLKSALLARKANGPVHGYGFGSIREKAASLFYHKRWQVSRQSHAIDRIRTLFASTFKYSLEGLTYQGLPAEEWQYPVDAPEQYALVIPGTTWDTKHWLDNYWKEFLEKTSPEIKIYVVWGSPAEEERANALADGLSNVSVFDRWLSLEEMAQWLAHAKWVVGVDTGFVHLASTMRKPTLGIYGPTDPNQCGVKGDNNKNVRVDLPCMPCHKKQCSNPDDEGKPKCMSGITPAILLNELTQI